MNVPESVNNSTLVLAYNFAVPFPGFRVDGLTNTTQDTQTAKVVSINVVCTKTTEETDGRRSRVELRQLVLVNGLPVTGRGGINGRRLKDGSGDTKRERTIDNVCVASDPANIRHASESVVWMHIEDVLDGERSAQQITTSSVDDTLGLSGGSRCL